ncbi:helix-turn-helix transcriptional regulator [Planktomarina sp.]|nr:helix-turn-helix transcriptional regulator [Planktomarina sp.]
MVSTLGDRWSLIILRDILFNKKKHYNEFLNAPEKISTNILANRLKMMEKEKLLSSSIDQKNRRLKIYIPTQKARDLEPVLKAVEEWGQKYS